ncbi:cupin [Streptomyces aidingensis]|uniref:Cupin n=1 Tax=Streptomyces aidingensis TaxID=910347 RepID=A0A1I1FTL1_9ACTN|nr:cupin [Streptomyces aidingensis]SFC02346.1 hypothetical protein SAMN05421773_101855 [Streptomyces aidingensis]
MEDLTALAELHLARAQTDDRGRSAHLFLHDGPLRQSVIAMRTGAELDEHEAPPAASLQVLHGRVRVTTEGNGAIDLEAGQLTRLPQLRQTLRALDDAVVLLTAVTATPGCGDPHGAPAAATAAA